MRYGTIPIVRETGGLKDTVSPYNMYDNTGNGFTFDRYESGLLYDAINRAKTLYFESRKYWDDMVIRDMNKDVSWEKSAKQYKDMYVGLTPRDYICNKNYKGVLFLSGTHTLVKGEK